MSLIEQAVRQQLRFSIDGQINTEQLLTSYNKPSSKKTLKAFGTQLQRKLKDFVEFDIFNEDNVKSVEQEQMELQLAIIKQLYTEIVAKEKESQETADVKAHNAKIDALIAQKQDENLSNLSIEDLQKLRK